MNAAIGSPADVVALVFARRRPSTRRARLVAVLCATMSSVALRLSDRWLWDFWFAQDGDDVHVFYLQAPRALGDPELRHHNATIGHAVSADMRSWTVLDDALLPGAAGQFDDLATWTGSIIRHNGAWHLFYTGIARSERGEIQRVGAASSTDLRSWCKHGMLLEADPTWYEVPVRAGAGNGELVHWRDPWVDRGEDGRFHMFLCARAAARDDGARGVVGHAHSADLRSWTATAPIPAPGAFSQLEVPQVTRLGEAWCLLFSAHPGDHELRRVDGFGPRPQGGTHYLTADAHLGPYRLTTDDFLLGDENGRYYGGRLLNHGGEFLLFAWEQHDAQGHFVGSLSDPMPVVVDSDATLVIA